MQNKSARGIGLNHMSVRSVVAAECEASLGSVRSLRGTNFSVIDFHIGWLSQTPVCKYRKHGNRPAKIVGHQEKTAAWVNTRISGTRAAGPDRVEQLQFPVAPIDPECADRSFLLVANAVGLIC